MLIRNEQHDRALKEVALDADLVVVGGGLAGTCCAISAAREGARVVLVQDRPVLGGNASSEVRLWVLGATSHMGNNNRWAREGGLINEILLESVHRNPEGNAVLFDSLLLEKAVSEPNLTLLLNTAAHEVERRADGGVASVGAFCSQNSTKYRLRAPLFCDASGDGVLGFLAGAAFRIGAESRHEFGELHAPESETRDLLGHSLYFYARDTGQPVRYTPPAFALDDITKIPRYRRFSTQDQGCSLWWIEYGGRRDTVHDSEEIKWELWKVVYGVWDHIKNSGDFPDAETMTLEWVGMIPGKRESRRFEGDYMLTQQDIVEQRLHEDAVSFGGWAIDLHPSDGVYSSEEPCTQWHSRGVYQIPYRCLYSRNVPNLFLSGRIISSSHIAFGSTRVMATCAQNGAAVGVAAALAVREGLQPADLGRDDYLGQLQRALLRRGHYIPGHSLDDPADLAGSAAIEPSSTFELSELPADGPIKSLGDAQALLMPFDSGAVPEIELTVSADKPTSFVAELRTSSRAGGFTPDQILASAQVDVGRQPLAGPHFSQVPSTTNGGSEPGAAAAKQSVGLLRQQATRAHATSQTARSEKVRLAFDHTFDAPTYGFVCLMPNEDVQVAGTDSLVSGLTTVSRRHNVKVAKQMVQSPPEGCGIDRFEFWTPERWSTGCNLAARFTPSVKGFGAVNLVNGVERPTTASNAWVADRADPAPRITLRWSEPVLVNRIELAFDCDYDDSLEQVLVRHADRTSQLCVRSFRVVGPGGEILHRETDNHQARCTVLLDSPLRTGELSVELDHPNDRAPASLFAVRCYGPDSPAPLLSR